MPMRKITIAVLLIAAMTVPALAQTGAPPAKITLEFDAQQINLLGEALQSLPKRVAYPFLADLQRQLNQKAEAEKVAATEAAKKKPEPKK